MSIRKKIFLFLLTVLLVVVVWQWELLSYGIKQGKGQLHIVLKSVELTELLADPTFPDSLRAQIDVIQLAREFAVQELGLKDTDNYTTYFDQQGEVSLWNVTACAPYAFTPKTWWFPIVGTVPYKGYFDKTKALAVAAELEAEGWDVRVRPVGGWSTLGWFRDPILSSMLERSEGELAELIIHELTHSTVFISNQVTFNENLASFIGEQGARLFLAAQYGDSSVQLRSYLNGERDSRLFTAYILQATKRLDSLYTSFPEDLAVELKQNRKQEMIGQVRDGLATVPFTDERYAQVFKNGLPNNAYFMSYVRYHSYSDSLNHVLETHFGDDIREFVKEIKAQYGR
jgi:predicted aminopeptidase